MLTQQHHARSGCHVVPPQGFSIERQFFWRGTCGFEILVYAAALHKQSTHNDFRRYD